MIIDGKKIAAEIAQTLNEKVALLPHRPALALVIVGEDPVTDRFVRIKKKFAEEVGVHVEEHRFTDAITTDMLMAKVEDISLDDTVDGVVVQLPLPESIDKDAVLGAIPTGKDVDVLSHEAVVAFEAGNFTMTPPVLGAMITILESQNIKVSDKKVVVVGRGALVGKPAAEWFKSQDAEVVVLGRGDDIAAQTIDADIIVLGAGSPNLLTPDMIKEGVVILDGGTTEAEEKLQGDASAVCAEKSFLFTPVPGGVGPVTVAVLFSNLIASL